MWLAGHFDARPFFVWCKTPDAKTAANMVKSRSGVNLLNPSSNGRVLFHRKKWNIAA
jgi:hypothetical protein